MMHQQLLMPLVPTLFLIYRKKLRRKRPNQKFKMFYSSVSRYFLFHRPLFALDTSFSLPELDESKHKVVI